MLYATGLRAQKRRPARGPLIKKIILLKPVYRFTAKKYRQALRLL